MIPKKKTAEDDGATEDADNFEEMLSGIKVCLHPPRACIATNDVTYYQGVEEEDPVDEHFAVGRSEDRAGGTDEFDDHQNQSAFEAPIIRRSIPLLDFSKRLAEQRPASNVGDAEASSLSESEAEEDIPAVSSTPIKASPGVVQNASDRMRPLTQLATIIIGDKTTTSVLDPTMSGHLTSHRPFHQLLAVLSEVEAALIAKSQIVQRPIYRDEHIKSGGCVCQSHGQLLGNLVLTKTKLSNGGRLFQCPQLAQNYS